MAFVLGVFHTTLGHRDRVSHAIAGFWGEKGCARSFGHDTQLLDRSGSLQVTGHHHRGVSLVFKPAREFSRQSRLTGTL